MYAVDDDTDELVRYSFNEDEYVVIGEVVDDSGNLVDEIESLGYIPSGPHRGLYGVTNFDGDLQTRLVKIDVFTGSTTVYPTVTGFGNVEGMVAVRATGTNEWTLYATHRSATPQGGGGTKNLLRIDPATGLGSVVMNMGQRFEALAQGPDGTLFGARGNKLWTIDPEAGTVLLIGQHGFADVEAMEFASGDYAPSVNVPGVPPEWTANGVLFGFSDAQNAVIIINPATGQAVEWPCAVNTTDCEGMVMLTIMSDPYGPIVANPSD